MTGRVADRPVRDCQHPVAVHVHGTTGAYINDQCRCEPCTAAIRVRYRHVYRLRAYGQWRSRPTAVGTQRRIHALMTLGWSSAMLGEHLGVSAARLRQLQTVQLVAPRTADAVSAMYDQLSGRAPDARMQVLSRVRNIAKKRGYAPPIAWDEDTIDDPTAVPYAGTPVDIDEVAVHRAIHGYPVVLHRAEELEVIRVLAARGVNDTEVARRLGKTREAICQTRVRHGIKQAAA